MNKLIKSEVTLFVLAAMLCSGCTHSQPVSKVVEEHRIAIPANGRSAVCRYENGIVSVIDLFDGTGQLLLKIQLHGKLETSNSVRITDAKGEMLAETNFQGAENSTSRTSTLVRFSQNVENDSLGKKDRRQWWHQDGYLLFEETVGFDSSGKLSSVSVRGPYAVDIKRTVDGRSKN